MSEWKTCTLSDLGKIVGGATPSTRKKENYENGKISWITPKDLANYPKRFISRGERNITEIGLKSCSAQLMPVHTVLFSSRAPIGYIAIASQELCTNQGFKSIIPNKKTDYMFLFYLLKYYKDEIENMSGGTTFKEISGTVMKNICVHIPVSIEEQRNIAKVLSTLDDKIENNIAINANLEKQIRTIINSYLIGSAPFESVSSNDWEKIPLSSLAHFISGYSYKGDELKKSSVAIATIKNFNRNGGFKLDGFKEIIPSKKLKPEHIVNRFDILVAHTDLTQNAEIIGNAELVMSLSSYENIIFSMDVVRVVSVSTTISNFLIAAILQTPQFKRHCLGYVNGTTVLHLSKKALQEYTILLPKDLSVLKPLDETVTSMFLRIASNIEECSKLEKIRNCLLHKLMTGEIDVSEIDL